MSFYTPHFWLTWLVLERLRLNAQYKQRQAYGFLLYKVIKRRRIVEVNLALCFPEKGGAERQRMVLDVFESDATGMFETNNAWWSSPARHSQQCQIEGLEYTLAAIQSSRGVLPTSANYSTQDLEGGLLIQHLDLEAVYRPHNNPLLNHFMSKSRKRSIKQLIHNENNRSILRSLRKGNAVWFAPNQDIGPKQSVNAPFFGVPAITVPPVSKRARLGKANVMIFSHYSASDKGDYLLRIQPAPRDFPIEDEAIDTVRANSASEEAIRGCTTLYMWVHCRFKTALDGSNKASLYN